MTTPTRLNNLSIREFVPVENEPTRHAPITLPKYADNAAALAAELEPGQLYRLNAGGIDVVHLPEYANNAAALADGLSVGDFYLDITADATGRTVKEVVSA